MVEITSKEWFVNLKHTPDSDSEEYIPFWEDQQDKCINGCFIEGVYIPGELYWHLNFWKTKVDELVEIGGIMQPRDKLMNPLLRDNEWIIFNEIRRAHIEKKGLMIFGARRLSKDLLNSSLLYCEDGVSTIGEARVGQRIYDRDGKLTTITNVYPQGIKPVYKVTLKDGREVFCGKYHEWAVINKNNKEIILTTEDIKNKISKTNPFYIQNTAPIDYSEKDFLIDPYILGYHLGDGDSKTGRFCSLDPEPVEAYSKYYEVVTYSDRLHHRAKKLVTDLKRSGVYDNKHVPEEYFMGSVDQRFSLLAGLLDSDGTVGLNTSKNGKIKSCVRFTNTNIKLVEAVKRLVFSLGGSCRVHSAQRYRKGVKNKIKYDVLICFEDLRMFRIETKRNKLLGRLNYKNRVPIKGIEYVYDAETTCISVDNKNKLFLTDNYVPTHNSTTLSSYLCHGATFDEGSQNILAGTNSNDIKTLVNMMDLGLNNLPDYFTWLRVEDDWKKQVTLGARTKTNKKIPFSNLIIRNLSDGNNEEAIAGTKPRRLVIDEAGKSSWLDAYLAAAPGFTTRFGLACSPIISGTSGDMEKYHDAKKVFFDCEAYNFLSYDDIKVPKRTHGLFLGAKYRQDGKVESTLGEFLDAPKGSDLYNFPMEVADEEKAFRITDENIEKLRKTGEKKKYLKEKMYFPKEVDDVFLNTNANMYNVDAVKAQQLRINTMGLKGFAVELYNDGNGIQHKASNKEFITEYPLKTQDPDAPIMIWEFPVPNPPKFLYVAGIDPYKHDNAKYTDSLGCIYIFKRIHSITGDDFQDSLVACYCARPESQDTWNENARMLLKFYNAYGLCENDELSFINYMKSKNEAEIYLAPQPKVQTSLMVNSSLNRPFGVSRAPAKMQNFMHGLYKQYQEEIISVTKDDEGNIISELTGIRRIFDYALLEETANYFDGANVDRMVAFQCALTLASELDPLYGSAAKERSDSRSVKMLNAINKSPKLFKEVSKPFRGGGPTFKRK